MSKRKGGKGWAVAAGVGGLLAFAGLAAAGQGGGGGGGWSTPGGGGGSGGGGGGGSNDPWQPGPGGNGRVYGGGGSELGNLPADFDFSGNGLWISLECDGVLEGSLFRPRDTDFAVNAIEPDQYPGFVPGEELDAVLRVDPANTVAGFIDWWMAGRPLPAVPLFAAWVESHWRSRQLPRPLNRTIRIVAELLRQVAPMCMEGNPEDWGDGLKDWLEDFMLWFDLYLHEWWSDEIAFNLGEE